MDTAVGPVAAAIGYVEDHLQERLDLRTVAAAVHYSPYHLHRMFAQTVGLSIQTYAQRRRLTEAAKQLVFSDRPLLDIALTAGYASQQAFSDVFKAMYKESPRRFRAGEEYYPLQLRMTLCECPPGGGRDWRADIRPAAEGDIPAWMELVRMAVDGFPHLDEGRYLETLRAEIAGGRALILRDAGVAAGAALMERPAGSIGFLGVHPQYRGRGVAMAFCQRIFSELAEAPAVSITTFREGDRADTGHRAALKRLGFTEAERLVEFGYPTQRMVLRREALEDAAHA